MSVPAFWLLVVSDDRHLFGHGSDLGCRVINVDLFDNFGERSRLGLVLAEGVDDHAVVKNVLVI